LCLPVVQSLDFLWAALPSSTIILSFDPLILRLFHVVKKITGLLYNTMTNSFCFRKVKLTAPHYCSKSLKWTELQMKKFEEKQLRPCGLYEHHAVSAVRSEVVSVSTSMLK
jgi:hypothetical protein